MKFRHGEQAVPRAGGSEVFDVFSRSEENRGFDLTVFHTELSRLEWTVQANEALLTVDTHLLREKEYITIFSPFRIRQGRHITKRPIVVAREQPLEIDLPENRYCHIFTRGSA